MGKRLRDLHYSATEIEKILDFVNLCDKQIALFFNDVFHSQTVGLVVARRPTPLLCDITNILKKDS